MRISRLNYVRSTKLLGLAADPVLGSLGGPVDRLAGAVGRAPGPFAGAGHRALDALRGLVRCPLDRVRLLRRLLGRHSDRQREEQAEERGEPHGYSSTLWRRSCFARRCCAISLLTAWWSRRSRPLRRSMNVAWPAVLAAARHRLPPGGELYTCEKSMTSLSVADSAWW